MHQELQKIGQIQSLNIQYQRLQPFLTKNYDEWIIFGNEEENKEHINNLYIRDKKNYEKTIVSLKKFKKDHQFKFLHLVKSFNTPSHNDKLIYSTSIRKFKGLESSIIIITDLDDINSDENKFILHTGITRCKNKLFVLAHERVKLNL